MRDDHLEAALIATAAGGMLLRVRGDDWGSPEALRDEGDRRSQELIAAELAARFPGDAVLSEEAADDETRLSADRVWIIDPLDGTREFSEDGRTDWAVHVALWSAGELVAGAVALPGLGLTLATGSPLPAPPPDPGDPLRLLVSRTRPPAQAETLRDALGAEYLPMGSAGAKAMAVVRGEADVYAHGGGQYEWDSAAPVAVAAAAGFHVSRLDGSPLVYNQPSPWLPDLLICHPAAADRVLAALGGG